MRSGKISLVWTAVALMVAAPCQVQSAAACGNEVIRRIDPRAAAVQQAEQLASSGNYELAQNRIVNADPQLSKRKVGAEVLSDRGLLVLAKVAARSGGKVFHGHPTASAASDEQRAKALQWSAQIAKEMHVRKSDDAASATDLAEILSHLPARHTEALELLVRLEKKDVVATAHGYAALAAMRAEIGAERRPFVRGPLRALHDAPRAIEEARCQQMTKVEGVCSRSKRGA